MAREKIDVTATVTVDKDDRDRLLAEGFKPIVRWVEGRSETALKTMDALAVVAGRAKGRAARENPHKTR
jgi:hypothetical protein